jgi:HAMP domain-containing protein
VIFSGAVALVAIWLWLLQPIIDLHRLRTARGKRSSR